MLSNFSVKFFPLALYFFDKSYLHLTKFSSETIINNALEYVYCTISKLSLGT